MDEQPTHLDLFSGIGGFAIAAEEAGFKTIAFCEIEERCAKFLETEWGLPVERDIRKLDGRKYRGISLLTGGPPCQPASRAGKQGGAGDDHWLWEPALRVLDEAKPDCVVFENPPGILDVGLDGILSEMGRSGYEVQCFDIPACAVDSPQLRHRIWIVGFLADSERERRQWRSAEPRETEGRQSLCSVAGLHWQNSIWVPCADGKLRRAPDDSFELVDGVHRSLLAALGNSICPEVATEILKSVRQFC